MFSIHKSTNTACLLCTCYYVQRHSRFTGRFRPVNLYDSASWHTACSKCDIQSQTSCRNNFDWHYLMLAKFHYTSFSVYVCNFFNSFVYILCLVTFICRYIHYLTFFLCHKLLLFIFILIGTLFLLIFSLNAVNKLD